MREPFGSLGEIYLKLHLRWWLLVGSMGGVLESPNGTNVRQTKQRHGNMVEADKDQGLLGKILRERNQSQIKDQQVQRKHLKVEKVFHV